MAIFVFCKDFVDISYENSHIHTKRLNVAAAYLFLKYSFILVSGFFFPIDGTLILTTSELQNLLCFLYRLNQPLWKIDVIA